MGAPGSLIPAEIFSTKEASFKSYNPIVNKLPTLLPTKDSGLVYTRPTLPGQYEGSSQSYVTSNGLPLGRKSSSENKESLPSVSQATTETGVGSSGFKNKVATTNQLDHVPSSAIGTSLYKGGRGPNAVGDGLRMNVNVVPYSQNSTEDTKNLFADLNPFQIKGSGKASMQNNNPTENRVEDFQRLKNSVISGRPPQPLMWKNRYPCNEIPKKKEHDFVEGFSAKNNYRTNDYHNMPLASSSSVASERVYTDDFKLPDNSYPAPRENSDRVSSSGWNLSLEDDQRRNYKDEYQRDADFVHNEELDNENRHKKSSISLNDHRKSTQDRFMGTSLKFKDPESPSSSFDSSASHIHSVVDDVSECEIPWEDLVIGERIGLGKHTWLFCFTVTS